MTDMLPKASWIGRRPWLWVWLAFIVLIAVWTVFIFLAVNHQPEVIPLPHASGPSH